MTHQYLCDFAAPPSPPLPYRLIPVALDRSGQVNRANVRLGVHPVEKPLKRYMCFRIHS